MRAALLTLAVLAAAWFAFGVRQAHDTARATAIVSSSGHPTPRQARRARELLDAAAFLNPDRHVDVIRAELALELGRVAQARAILDRIVASESDNAEAWYQLARSSAGSPGTFDRAVINWFRLEPAKRAR